MSMVIVLMGMQRRGQPVPQVHGVGRGAQDARDGNPCMAQLPKSPGSTSI